MAVQPIEKALENLSHVLKILHTYPKEMEQIGFHDLVKPDAVATTYSAWNKLYSKYDGNEKEHFSDTWFPILCTGYEFFIDLASAEYPIIESTVNICDNSSYISLEYFESMNELLFLLDEGNDMERFARNYQDFRNSVLFSFFHQDE